MCELGGHRAVQVMSAFPLGLEHVKGEQVALKKHQATNTKEPEVTKEAAIHLTSVSRGTTVMAHHPQAASSVFSDRLQIVQDRKSVV